MHVFTLCYVEFNFDQVGSKLPTFQFICFHIASRRDLCPWQNLQREFWTKLRQEGATISFSVTNSNGSVSAFFPVARSHSSFNTGTSIGAAAATRSAAMGI
jgi:hypothetical protein